jgi:hypothetical protein
VHRRTCPYLAEPSLKSSALIDVDSTNAAGDSCSATRKDIIKVAGLADVGPVSFQRRGITLSQTAKVDAALEQRRARIKAGLRDGSVLPTTQGSDATQLQNQQGQGPDKGLPDRAQHRQSGAECHARAQRAIGRHADVAKSQTRTPVEIPRKAARMVSVFCCSLRATCISTCAASGLQQGWHAAAFASDSFVIPNCCITPCTLPRIGRPLSSLCSDVCLMEHLVASFWHSGPVNRATQPLQAWLCTMQCTLPSLPKCCEALVL